MNFEIAGPREHLRFDSAKTTGAIVACGGLCPGVNDVVRGDRYGALARYRITRILGNSLRIRRLGPKARSAAFTVQAGSRLHDSDLRWYDARKVVRSSRRH
jgi:hypothetical protein